MKAMILAAGIGRRLGRAVHDGPKCLIKFNGISLLERHLETMRRYPIEEVVVAVGYQREAIEEEISRVAPDPLVRLVYNPNYQKGSIVSLWSVREHLASGDDVLLTDADVLYDHRLLQRLVNGGSRNCFLLDRDFEPGDEPVKLCLRNNRLVEFRKQLNPALEFDMCGESVGFFRFSSDIAKQLAARSEFYISAGLDKEPYEEAIRDLLLAFPDKFTYEDITGLPWIEIDFPSDIRRAEWDILPKITKSEH
ncbi:MAG: phosphocholine cytidylyltransferase family protein [Gammaproteobacteria bacterium]|nr:phosphocholine cytidylyltransferase family protein [Gammaproteobacteria bacterium]MCI0591233.1 phosphocholine cytidylyltransferase family protein [Gammaproteobacteria bacterium]